MRGDPHKRRDGEGGADSQSEERYPSEASEESGTDAIGISAAGDEDASKEAAAGSAEVAAYAAARADSLAGVGTSSATRGAYGVYPLASSFLMSAGLILIGVACYFSGGDLFAADNKAICLLMMGAALEMMSLLLVAPVAAFFLAITIIGFVAMAFLHRQTRAACCPGPANDGQEILDDELQEEAEMFCML